jgi:hypothetical protein
MHRAGIDFAGRSQAKGEVMAIELGDSGISLTKARLQNEKPLCR